MSKNTVILAVVGIVLAAVTALAIVLKQTAPSGSGDEAEKPGPPRVYAYMKVDFGQDWTQTRSELVAMNGTKRIGRASFGWIGTHPAFTTDGRYVFTTISDRVLAISATTGKVTKVPCAGCQDRSLKCQCQTVVPVGAAKVAWLDKGNHLVIADLAAKAPTPRRTATTVPTWRNMWDEAAPQLLAGTDGAVLAAYTDSLSTKTGPVYLVTLDGGPRRLAPHRPDSVESAQFSPDGTQVALAGDEAESCATVTVVNVRSGEGRTRPVKAAEGAKCHARDGYVGEMWWDPDGALNVYFQPAEKEETMNGVQRRLAGDRWVAANAAPASQAHRLAAGATAVLSHPGVRDRDFLYVEIGGRSTRVAREVNRVIVPTR
ncbi:hypothetical protein [Streptomyces sp. ME19-01-6]|uniref:hypothetical protein n=1 Tax=Streptomyces sp. ME19-01-6 TaxID=3028686 RepID=UPI0029A2F23C|nr:hypothetical protein [Streptomyces sp. ME19-01-6]MDX3227421.1 hypothetical protein [Streptomyces sp. ME19-01-6]